MRSFLVPLSLSIVLTWSFSACRVVMDIPDGPDAPCDGDGVRDEGETCDGTDLGGFTCENLGYHGGQLTCTPGCRWDAADCEASGFCGDGELQTGDEECDGPALGDATCESLGFSGGLLSCDAACAFDTSGCQAICDSDGVKDEWEICDRDDLGGATCESLGYHGGVLSCTSACTYNLADCLDAGRCGDGVHDEGFEDCEPDNVMVTSCESLGFHPGTLNCGEDCRFDTTGCDGRCGDGVVNLAYEQCDGTNLAGAACESLGFYPGILQCTDTCTYNTTGCTGRCGDGVVQPAHEQCEPGHPNAETCRGIGHFDGELCGDDCAYDEGRCLDVAHLTAGAYFTCAVLSDGTARCWGANPQGQLGLGTTSTQATTTPAPTLPLPGVTVLSGGGNHTCALLGGGSLSCWGFNNYGQMGQGHLLTPQVTPMTVPGLGTVSAVSTGQDFTCALLSDQTVKCWGRNDEGQLGIGNRVDQPSPQTTSLVPGVLSVEAGNQHACAIVNPGGALLCWGANGNGQLGDDSTNDRLTPVAVSGLTSVFAVSAGGAHTCAIDTGGTTWCWGGNGSGQVGDGVSFPSLRTNPVQPDWSQTAVALATGDRHTCAITVSGAVYCWGECGSGQCGSGGTSDRSRPNQVSGLTGVAGIAAGDNHTCVRLATGALRCWGANAYGQLGDGTTFNRYSPVEVLP